ncbi:hypothetical protein [Heyndrickxia ginsengihumi]|uniref:hypothetical protein n=1 Tax=Heyndrickxia ginsengihumi TaxID=363870 RepID=UPI003D19D5B8
MNCIRGILFLTICLCTIFNLVGCGSNNTVNKQVQPSNAEVKKEGQAAKKYLMNQFSNVNKDFDQKHSIHGWIEAKDFRSFRNEYNILAVALKIRQQITINDDDDFKKLRKKINDKIHSLSDTQAIQSKKNIRTAKVIYKAALMADMHQIQDESDINNSDENELREFMELNSDSKSAAEITKSAKESINNINTTDMRYIKNTKSTLEKYRECFTQNELKLLIKYFQTFSPLLRDRYMYYSNLKKAV